MVPTRTFDKRLCLTISCIPSDWQLSSLTQVYSSSFPQTLISMVNHLYIEDGFRAIRGPGFNEEEIHEQDDVESSQWLELFHSFTTVKHLRISEFDAKYRIGPAICRGECEGSVTDPGKWKLFSWRNSRRNLSKKPFRSSSPPENFPISRFCFSLGRKRF